MRLGVLSDIHLAPAGSLPGMWHNPLHYERAPVLLDRAISFLRDRDVDAVAVLGDLTNSGDRASIAQGLRLLGLLTVPVYVLPGNHDWGARGEVLRTAIEANQPSRIALPRGDRNGHFPFRLAGVTALDRRDEGITWHVRPGAIEADGDGPLLVMSHFPLLDREQEIVAQGLKFAGDFAWSSSTRDPLLTRSAPTVLLHGHLHIRYATTEGTILQLGFASLIEAPHEVSLVEIAERDGELTVSVEHHSVETDDVPVVPVLSASRSIWSFQDHHWTNDVGD